MITPFDKAVTAIALARYHNHRLEAHSDTVSTQIFTDLVTFCPHLRDDLTTGEVQMWLNVSAPGDRLRKVDLVVGESGADGAPPHRQSTHSNREQIGHHGPSQPNESF
jgi:hypothetical protein